jgi:hydrogenase expression/formation protein HypC
MCLGIPMEVISIDDDKKVAAVEIGGTKQKVRLDIVNEVPKVGDFVIVHAGFAIYQLDKKEAQETLKLFKKILAEEGSKIY